MVADGWSVIVLQPWLLWPPGLAIAFTILAFGLLGDAVRDAAAETWAPPQQGLGRLRTRRFLPASVSASSKSQSSGSLLAIEALSVGFRTASGTVKTVIDNLSFEIAAGETVGLVGESGSGKSVTALSILDLLPAGGMIEHGEIYFDGKSLTKMREAQLHEHRGSAIGLISQEPMASLNPAFRIGAQLAEVVRRHHHVSRRSARRRAVDLLSQVRLPEPDDVARRYPHELSGGMAQRVSIARALAGDPKLLIADEPTTALDVTLQAEILELLRTLQAQRAMSILLVTHDWGVVADICDRAVVLYAGQVVECAEVSTIYRQPLHPYTEALLAANPHGAEAGVSLPTIPGAVPNPGGWPTGCHFHPRCSYATDACRERPIPIERPSRDHQTRCIHYGRVGTK
jgi:peptide/nickel transport system ATP-binding protein/peptide/nickel transport system permease protein